VRNRKLLKLLRPQEKRAKVCPVLWVYYKYKVTSRADWRNFADVRDSLRHADVYCHCVVFDIKGNDYRLITIILYPVRHVYIRYVLTHAEYDKGNWKNDCDC
jgi:mRNA interferase HigB